MTASTQRLAVGEAAAWDSLTERQRTIVQLVTRPTSKGERRCIVGIARGLGVSRQAIYDTLRLAGAKFEDFAHAIDRGSAA